MVKRTLGSWTYFFVKLFLLALITTTLSFVLFTLANFSDNAKNFFFAVKTNDTEMAKKELIGLHYFYDLGRKLKIQWLADKYLFRDASFYETADFYLVRDWERVRENLREKLDDPQSYPYGNAKFRQIDALYQDHQISLEEALKIILNEVAVDYEKALKNCLDSGVLYVQCYDRVWNYDLATNRKDLEEALKSHMPQVKFILGPPKKEGEPVLPPPVVPGGGGKEESERPGFGGGSMKRP